MNKKLMTVGLLALVSQVGCYRMTVKDSRYKEGEQVENSWSHYAVDGLVPIGDRPVETQDKCPGGIAKVETELSFMNLLVSGITLGLYSPMSVRYWCADGERSTNAAPAAKSHKVADASR